MMFGTIVPELRADAGILAEKLARLDKIRLAVEKEKHHPQWQHYQPEDLPD